MSKITGFNPEYVYVLSHGGEPVVACYEEVEAMSFRVSESPFAYDVYRIPIATFFGTYETEPDEPEGGEQA